MLNESLPARNCRALQTVARLTLWTLFSTLCVATLPPPAVSAEPESLTTGIVPTMGINEVTEGTLLFKTNQSGRYLPAPILKTDLQIAVTGIIARPSRSVWSNHHVGTSRRQLRLPLHEYFGLVYYYPFDRLTSVGD